MAGTTMREHKGGADTCVTIAPGAQTRAQRGAQLRRGRAATFAVALAAAAGVVALPLLAGSRLTELTATPAQAATANAAIEEALAPIIKRMPPGEELAAVKAAIQAAFAKDFAKAERIASTIQDPAAKKLIRWYELRVGAPYASAAEMAAFHQDYPGWPDDALKSQAEVTLLKRGTTTEILAFFKGQKPSTGPGRMALAAAYAENGRGDEAAKLASRAWRNDDFGPEGEAAALARAGQLLDAGDHKGRADRLLYDDNRYSEGRGKQTAQVERLLPLLGADDQAKIRARMAVYRCVKGGACAAGAKAALAKVPQGDQDWGITYHRIQLMRRMGQEAAAFRAMAQVPGTAKGLTSPDDWWLERRMNVYTALYAGDARTAYKIAADAGDVSANPRKDSQFLAGFIAFRRLNNPKQGLAHFTAMRKAADGPISMAQSDYWLGRTYEALGDAASAQTHFEASGRWFNTYYGQLARQRLNPQNTALNLRATKVPSAEAIANFRARDSVRAAVIAQKAGLNDLMRVFMLDLREKLEDEGEYVLLAHLAAKLGDTQMSVRVAKTAMDKGHDLTPYAYPTVGMPKFEPLRPLGDMALYYAVARQESEFNTLTLSGAGARGVLQVMPATARDVCRTYKLKCDKAQLFDPVVNAQLGSAYVADRIDDFSGSYVLGFAGYNAGPGRARGWIRSIGDPRDPRVDPVDWVEMVHIEETREYIKKVLANVQVYRARLGTERPLRIAADIARARPVGEAN